MLAVSRSRPPVPYGANFLFFIFMPCTELSWPSRQFLSAHKCIVSYYIVVDCASQLSGAFVELSSAVLFAYYSAASRHSKH